MWILPKDLPRLQIERGTDPLLLPWHYADEEVDRLAWLLRRMLDGVDAELRLDDATLEVLSARKLTVPTSLVVAVVRETSPGFDEIAERVRALGAACALLQFPEPQEMGYGWLEREVKAPLYKAIGSWVKQPEHPLAALNVQALPVMAAAALTTDPIELMEILERALTHRVRHADVGCEEDDYQRSLLLAAGVRLAKRLSRLDARPLEVSSDLGDALGVLISGEEGVEDRGRYRAGAKALDRIGLGRFTGGELSLGPLARQATESLVLGAIEAELPRHVWSDAARTRLGAILRAHRAAPPAASLAVRSDAAPAMVDVPPPLDLLAPVAGDDAYIAVLREVAALPTHCAEIPAALRDRLVRVFRRLDDVKLGTNVAGARAAFVLDGLLRVWAARGAGALAEQEEAIRRLENAPGQEPEPWRERAVAIAGLRHAVLLVQHPRTREDIDSAEARVKRYLDAARREAQEDSALDVAAYLCLADIALRREDHDLARDWANKALHGARQTGDPTTLATSMLALARAARDQKMPLEAERYAREALELFETTGDPARISACLRVLAAILLARHEGIWLLSDRVGRDEAQALAERSLAMTEGIGDAEGRIESLLVLVSVAIYASQHDRLSELAFEVVSLAESIASPTLRAEAYSAAAAACFTRDDRDQAVAWARRSLEIFETLGVKSAITSTRQFLADATET